MSEKVRCRSCGADRDLPRRKELETTAMSETERELYSRAQGAGRAQLVG